MAEDDWVANRPEPAPGGVRRGEPDCPDAPSLALTVAGQPVPPRQNRLSGNGTYCGAIGDGVAADFLAYETKARWDTMAYGVSDSARTTRRSGKLSTRRLSFTLPEEPGTYYVGIQGESKYDQISTYFKVIISGEGT